MRGFFGIGCYQPKTSTNLGTLWRSCLEFNAGFMFTVAARCFMETDRHEPQERIEKLASFAGQPSNTTKADRHIPLFVWPELKDMTLPTGAMLVGIEQSDRSTPLESFTHPEQAVYILGAEDRRIVGGSPGLLHWRNRSHQHASLSERRSRRKHCYVRPRSKETQTRAQNTLCREGKREAQRSATALTRLKFISYARRRLVAIR